MTETAELIRRWCGIMTNRPADIVISVPFEGCVFCLAEAQKGKIIDLKGNDGKTCAEHLERGAKGRYCLCCGADSTRFHSEVDIGYEVIECGDCGLDYSNHFDQEFAVEKKLSLDDFTKIYDDPEYSQGWKTRVQVRKLSSVKF